MRLKKKPEISVEYTALMMVNWKIYRKIIRS